MTHSYHDLKAWDHTHIWHPFTQMQDWLADDPVIIARGEGNYLYDTEGNRYLDGVSSLWCNIHGHNHPHLNEAIRSQLEKIAHSTLLGLSNIPSIFLARKLVEISPKSLTRVFYSDSGSTAVEISLKLALQYWQLKGKTKKKKFASLMEAYHGDTFGSMSVGYSDLFHHFFRPLLSKHIQLTPPHLFRFRDGLSKKEALETAIVEAKKKLQRNRDDLAAVIIEPLMQGAAGMWDQPVEYIQGLREITQNLGLLLICDEVATGFGRTGRMFASEHAGINPDLLCLGKGLTGGYLPVAATLATEEIFSVFLGSHSEFKAFFHGHSFTGNPLGCAAAQASLEVFEQENVLSSLGPKIRHLDTILATEITPLPPVSDVRTWGFMVGIELMREPDKKVHYEPSEKVGIRVVLEARRQGIILRPLGDIIILMPPLSITSGELDQLVSVVKSAITKVA